MRGARVSSAGIDFAASALKFWPTHAPRVVRSESAQEFSMYINLFLTCLRTRFRALSPHCENADNSTNASHETNNEN